MGLYITIKVTPGARVERIARGAQTDLACFVRAPAQDNKANIATITLLARALGGPARDISLVAGHTSRIKRLYIAFLQDKQQMWDILDIPVQDALCSLAGNQ
jgi:uncharacterized protein